MLVASTVHPLTRKGIGGLIDADVAKVANAILRKDVLTKFIGIVTMSNVASEDFGNRIRYSSLDFAYTTEAGRYEFEHVGGNSIMRQCIAGPRLSLSSMRADRAATECISCRQ